MEIAQQPSFQIQKCANENFEISKVVENALKAQQSEMKNLLALQNRISNIFLFTYLSLRGVAFLRLSASKYVYLFIVFSLCSACTALRYENNRIANENNKKTCSEGETFSQYCYHACMTLALIFASFNNKLLSMHMEESRRNRNGE